MIDLLNMVIFQFAMQKITRGHPLYVPRMLLNSSFLLVKSPLIHG